MRSLSIAATGMVAQQRNVEVVSNNLANMNTTGFMRRRTEFQDLMYQNLRRVGSTSSDAGTIVPSGVQLGLGVKLAAVYRIHEQGNLNPTDNAFDLAVQGKGYFQIQMPNGETAYTRDGTFQLNADGQVVISGSKAAVERAAELAKERGAKRAIMLPVSAPFHCALMQPAADVMADALANVTMNAPVLPLVANVTAAPTSDPAEIRAQLVAQVTGTVSWRETMINMVALGVTDLVEVGAGKVLSGLARRVDGIEGRAIGTPDDIEAFLTSL